MYAMYFIYMFISSVGVYFNYCMCILTHNVCHIGSCFLLMVQVVKLLKERYCQPPPPGCPRAVYAIMVDCW